MGGGAGSGWRGGRGPGANGDGGEGVMMREKTFRKFPHFCSPKRKVNLVVFRFTLNVGQLKVSAPERPQRDLNATQRRRPGEYPELARLQWCPLVAGGAPSCGITAPISAVPRPLFFKKQTKKRNPPESYRHL